MAIAAWGEARGRRGGVRGKRCASVRKATPAALVLTLLFMGATLPSPLYVIYRDELHFSQVTLTLIYAVYFAGAMTTAFFLGRISERNRTARGDIRRSCDQHRCGVGVHLRQLA